MIINNIKDIVVNGIACAVPDRWISIESQKNGENDATLDKFIKTTSVLGHYETRPRQTAADLAFAAAKRILDDKNIDRTEIGVLVFVTQYPDYKVPSTACVLQNRLGLSIDCLAFDVNLGCSGYVYALMTAHAMIESRAVGSCLVLAGDLCARATDQTNRKGAPVFGDAASATYLKYSEDECQSTFVMGADGKGWNKIVRPFGGWRIPLDKDTVDLRFEDVDGNFFEAWRGVMKGEDVFAFTMDVVPQLISDTMSAAGWTNDDIDLFSIHQANKQILEMIVTKAGIPLEKTPTDVFTKYANNSTNSVVTVVCDQPKERKIGKTIMAAFGIGLSWGGAALDLSGMYNGGISTYHTPADAPSRDEQIEYWRKYFKGEV